MRLKGVTPSYSKFDSTWKATLELLERELTLLVGRKNGYTYSTPLEFVLQIDIEEGDLRINGELRSGARPQSPAVAIAIDSKASGPLLFVCGEYVDWRDNVRAIAKTLEALRAIDRYGVTKAAEQYRGFGALPPGTPMPAAKMSLDEAETMLRRYWHGAVSESRDWELLYRRGAKELHPDVGGDPAAFRKLTEARDLLLASAS